MNSEKYGKENPDINNEIVEEKTKTFSSFLLYSFLIIQSIMFYAFPFFLGFFAVILLPIISIFLAKKIAQKTITAQLFIGLIISFFTYVIAPFFYREGGGGFIDFGPAFDAIGLSVFFWGQPGLFFITVFVTRKIAIKKANFKKQKLNLKTYFKNENKIVIIFLILFLLLSFNAVRHIFFGYSKLEVLTSLTRKYKEFFIIQDKITSPDGDTAFIVSPRKNKDLIFYASDDYSKGEIGRLNDTYVHALITNDLTNIQKFVENITLKELNITNYPLAAVSSANYSVELIIPSYGAYEIEALSKSLYELNQYLIENNKSKYKNKNTNIEIEINRPFLIFRVIDYSNNVGGNITCGITGREVDTYNRSFAEKNKEQYIRDIQEVLRNPSLNSC